MKKVIFTILLFVISSTINCQDIFGKWNSKNDETGKIDSVIEVYKKDL